MSPRAVQRMIVAVWAAVLSAILLWPQHVAGYGLGHDMVFTPEQPLNAGTFGVGSTAPRAVPVDVLVALGERLVDGAVVGRLALALPLLLAGIGAARLLRDCSLPARLAACGWTIWNPFVVERLAIGQWSLLWGYAALPWLIGALDRYRRGDRGVAALIVPLAIGSITPTGGLLALLVTAAYMCWPGASNLTRSRRGLAVLTAAVVQAPWLVASALTRASTVSDPSGSTVFASRSEFGGAVVSLLSGGGIWDADVAPNSRATALGAVTLVIVVAAAVLGWRQLGRDPRVCAPALAVCAGVGFVLAVGSHVMGLSSVLRVIIGDVPGGGLLRDAQKWIAPLVLLEALLIGAAIERIRAMDRMRGPAVAGIIAASLALPLALLPDATRVVWPTLRPVRYPSGYAADARLVGGRGDVAVLPFQPYRQFSWAGDRVALDPAPRLLSNTVVVSDRLAVGRTTLGGEDARAGAVAAALGAGPRLPGQLARAGISWVLVEKQTPGDRPELAGLHLVLDRPGVRLYRVPGPVRAIGTARWRLVTAIVVLIAWLLGVAAAAVVALTRRRRRAEPALDLEREADR